MRIVVEDDGTESDQNGQADNDTGPYDFPFFRHQLFGSPQKKWEVFSKSMVHYNWKYM
jgi:hypothetical protein